MIAPSEAPPQRRYRLIAQIGRGGMAEVFLAVSQGPGGFNKLVVIKKTLLDLALRPEILSMFMDEARLAARMNHPNVVQTYELGEEDGRQFIAMEFLDGQPYSRVLARMRGREGGVEGMSFAHHLRVLADTLAGLHHAHELRDFDGTPLHVVHRDATPHNVFITYDGSIKVVDFGIAKAQDSASHTETGEIKGKISYMSPEQVRGEPLDRRSDVFAIGVMLWEAVAGRRMWQELPDVTVLAELLDGRVPSIRAAVPGVPEPLAAILDRALALDRDHRYPTALAMQRDLEHFAVSSGLRVDGAEVGRVVSELFEEERRRVRAVIEAQLGSLRWTGEGPVATSLPMIPTGSSSLSIADARAPAAPGPDPSRLPSSYTPAPTHSGAALSMRAPAPPGRRWGLWVAAGGGLFLLSALVIAVSVSSLRRGDERADGASSATSKEAEAPASITLKVRASPAEARILLDGVLLGGGTYEGKVQRATGERTLRVEADGYEAKEERISLSSDLVMSFALEKLATAPSASAVAVPGGAVPGGAVPGGAVPGGGAATAGGPAPGGPPGGAPLGPRPGARPGGGRIDDTSPYR